MVVKEAGGRRGIDWEFAAGRCKLLHLEWVNNRRYCMAQDIEYRSLCYVAGPCLSILYIIVCTC